MYLRKWHKRGKDYWALVESYRTPRGSQKRIVAYLGDMAAPAREGLAQAARGTHSHQPRLDEAEAPEWVEIDARRVRVERVREFGGPWLGLQVLEKLGLGDFLASVLPVGREEIPWATMAQVLVLGRFCDPSSELALAARIYDRSALGELLGVPLAKVNEDRLYRALDALRPHKEALEKHLKARLGQLFELEYDLLLYDVTSTYFEGLAEGNPLAQRGYSRDHRPDCKQVCLALVVAKGGMPLSYQLFAGNRADVTTVEEVVEEVEKAYGAADRIWVMDRGMISEETLSFLQEERRRYIVGTPKGSLRRFERHLLEEGWEQIREGLEVKRCPAPGGTETFLLCRSAARKEKEQALHQRFEQRLEEGLKKLAESCQKRKHRVGVLERRIGRLLERNSRAAGLFQVDVKEEAGRPQVVWRKQEAWREWAGLSEGCYLLRSNICDWSGAQLWEAYIQLTQAEAAFRIHKQDLALRPIWHQKQERVEAHLLVCFLAYVLWKALGQLCARGGLGDEPRKVLEELSQIRVVDVVLPTRSGVDLRRRCVAEPTKHQAILLQRLGLHLPAHLEMRDAWGENGPRNPLEDP